MTILPQFCSRASKWVIQMVDQNLIIWEANWGNFLPNFWVLVAKGDLKIQNFEEIVEDKYMVFRFLQKYTFTHCIVEIFATLHSFFEKMPRSRRKVETPFWKKLMTVIWIPKNKRFSGRWFYFKWLFTLKSRMSLRSGGWNLKF